MRNFHRSMAEHISVFSIRDLSGSRTWVVNSCGGWLPGGDMEVVVYRRGRGGLRGWSDEGRDLV